MMMPEQLIGIVYREGGRDLTGLDCWGVVMMASALLGIAVPDPFESHTERTVSRAQAQGATLEHFTDVSRWDVIAPHDASRGAVIAFTNPHGYVDHAGVLLDQYRFIHALRDVGVVIARRADAPWCRCVAGIYAYRG